MAPEGTVDALIADSAAAVAALSAVSTDVAAYREADDATLLELSRLAATQRQLADTHLALVAGEIAHRSAPALGHAGLAQRSGHRTPEELLRVSTRSTGREASTAVRVGRMMREAQTAGDVDPATGEVAVPTEPWLAPVASALAAGDLAVAAADAIRTGLGAPCQGVPEGVLREAAAQLCREAATFDADRLFRRARELRNELDEVGIADRERQRFEQRSLKLHRLPDGMTRLVWLMDPETSATVTDLFDRSISPRRGGPRFGPADEELSQRILDDPRTPEQIASDVFTQLLCAGADADSSHLLGTGAPTVLVTTTATDVAGRTGHCRIVGHHEPVSIGTVERLACTGGILPIEFDHDGQPLNLGREQRLFGRRQRIALAVRDGGCMFPGCERPPSWTEAHHVQHSKRDNGKTDIADGILICKHHHLLLHNNGWEIRRHRGRYWLIPPPDIDPAQTPIPMPSKSAAIYDLQRRATG